ncbi:MAG: polyphosphate kinase 1 [Saprospiraceae bacterium]|nr:polyphosphate kinase 1 [Saprospiraceae bacterium]
MESIKTEENAPEVAERMPYTQRDISWLSFNYRVLQEAKDPSVPLLERLKFLAIYSSNLDEFFRVRVAQHRNLIRISKKTKKELSYSPKQLLKEILRIVNEQQLEFSKIFEEDITNELREQNVYLLRRRDLNKEQQAFVEAYFKDNLLPFVQPVLLVKDKIRVFLNNAALYMTVALQPKESYTSRTEYAMVKIPSDFLPRFIELPCRNGHYEVIMIDDIVRHSVSWLFPGFEILDTYSIKLTRDAALYIDDEFSGNLIEKVKESLQKRNIGPASRFVYDRKMSPKLLDFLEDSFALETLDLFPEGRYHNNFDFFKFPDFGLTSLKYKPLPPQPYVPLEKAENYFAAIAERDHLLHFPYQSYESVIQFFERAAYDPSVTHIKIVQYRVAKKSRIMQALMQAVKNGKQVSVFIEVKARFDEAANIKWGEALQKAGVTVHYSMPGIKVHSKLALVSREERGKEKLYSYLGTGNFNEDTAKIYSDLCIFTMDERLTKEMANVFRYLETGRTDDIPPFKHLLVGQFNLREGLVRKIDREIELAQKGKAASMILKMNSLEDVAMIEKLYEASKAGVKIKIITRGICCLMAGVEGVSENIEVISIVDRFLEHARIFIFNNDGKEDIYLSSADWMNRNLSHRVETTFPIYSPELRQIVRDVIDLQLKDNVKARSLNPAHINEYKTNEAEIATRAQMETYFYFKK